MNLESLLAAIGKIVTEYNKSKNPSPAQLMEWMKKLTGYSWYFAGYVADVKAEYNGKYFIRKIEAVKEKDRLVKSGLAVNKSEIEAMLSTETAFYIEMEAESLAYKADLMLKQANRVCDTIRTNISLIKVEREQSNSIL
jgi:hypothetical protein